MKSALLIIRKYWIVMLGALAGLCWLVTTFVFYPGFMSNDSLRQLGQAIGREPYYDWHPPVMALLWDILISLTGKVGSLLAVQLLVFWVAIFLLSLYLYKTTTSRILTLLPFAAALSPIIINIAGVIWKDVHMAFALLLASVLALWVVRLRGWRQYSIMVIVSLLLVYAVMLRYNAFIAVLPIAFMAFYPVTRNRKLIGVSILAIMLVALGGTALIASTLNVKASNPSSAVMIDDVVHAVPSRDFETRQQGVSPVFQQAILSAQARCGEQGILLHAHHFV